MRTSLMARVLVVVFFAFGLLASASHAQSTNAAVGGQITDEQGRVVPGVTVVLTNLNTGVTYQAKTNGDGIYNAPALAARYVSRECNERWIQEHRQRRH